MSAGLLAPQLRRTPISAANPVSKLIAAFIITIAIVLSVDIVSAGVALILELALLPISGLALGPLARRLWPIPIAAVVAGYGTALLAEDSGAMLFQLGPISFSEGSLLAGVAITLRALAIALPGIILMATTDPTDLADGLAQRLKLPARFVLGALAGFRLMGLLVEEWQSLGLARRARGIESGRNIFARLKGFLGQAFGLLVQAIRRATRLSVAMEGRGFGGDRRTWARESRFTSRDFWLILGAILLAGISIAAAVLLGSWNFIGS
ncbi:energy-coupling factor transporter transmembrane component T [Saxibacter everestensis]|uniref:Energy-coupling factor transporter transmembrane component T n=1 Tax=Saxibacter everestensis TaxID=2909229 RepID=A0ABY8QSU2_9MICO|nr:energy-coupling factor transporter transmembrane component T [Brevibacteriaceae bacterium ZFBP1038]